MGRLSLAWQILTDSTLAQRVVQALSSEPGGSQAGKSEPAAAAPRIPAERPVAPAERNDAVSLLATLQREGRLIDFLKEPLDQYSDAQVGAAVRDIHRDCAAVVERQFALRPVIDKAEGDPVELEKAPDPGVMKLSGAVSDQRPRTGVLVHHGWKVTRCELPQWTGTSEARMVVSPAEVELRRE